MLERGKSYIITVRDLPDYYTPLRVNKLLYSYICSERGKVYVLDTKEFVKELELLEGDLISYEEVQNNQFFPQNLSFDELVSEMVKYINRHEKSKNFTDSLVTLSTVMKCKLKHDYGVDDFEKRREISIVAYNQTHLDTPYEYKRLS